MLRTRSPQCCSCEHRRIGHLYDEAVERSYIAYAKGFISASEKSFFRVYETRREVKLVVRTRGEVSNMGYPVARNADYAFAPMQQITALKFSHQAPLKSDSSAIPISAAESGDRGAVKIGRV